MIKDKLFQLCLMITSEEGTEEIKLRRSQYTTDGNFTSHGIKCLIRALFYRNQYITRYNHTISVNTKIGLFLAKANFFFYIFVAIFWTLAFYSFHAINMSSMNWLATVLSGVIINGLAVFTGFKRDVPWLRKTKIGKAILWFLILFPVAIIDLHPEFLNTVGVIWMWGIFTILGWKGHWDLKYNRGDYSPKLNLALNQP